MPIPAYGAPPLSKFFLFLRLLQLVAFTAIIGLTANFISEIISTNATPPREIIATLTITSLATLYTLVSIPFYFSAACTSLLVMTALDLALLIAFVVVAITLGRPISYLNCFAIASAPSGANAANAFAFTQSLGQNLGKEGNLVGWTGATRANCFETKAVWGMCIGLCVLFAATGLVLPGLFAKGKRAARLGGKGYV